MLIIELSYNFIFTQITRSTSVCKTSRTSHLHQRRASTNCRLAAWSRTWSSSWTGPGTVTIRMQLMRHPRRARGPRPGLRRVYGPRLGNGVEYTWVCTRHTCRTSHLINNYYCVHFLFVYIMLSCCKREMQKSWNQNRWKFLISNQATNSPVFYEILLTISFCLKYVYCRGR